MRLAALVVVLGIALAPRASAQARVHAGRTLPGLAIAVAPSEGAPRVLCEPDCALALPRGEARIGWRAGVGISWLRTITIADEDLRLDVRLEDRSAYRTFAYTLLISGAVLIGATAIVGIATEPEPPELGWFGAQHGLVFAGIAGAILLAFGIPGVTLALAFERDDPVIDAVPIDEEAPIEDAGRSDPRGPEEEE